MANEIKSFSGNDSVLIIGGVRMENLSDAGYTIEYINNFATTRTGINGRGIRNRATTRPVRVTVSLLPDSDEKHEILALDRAGALEGASSHTQIGTGEVITMFGLSLTMIDSRTRGVQTADQVSDDVLTFEFTDSEEI